jgi:hypothetical protein
MLRKDAGKKIIKTLRSSALHKNQKSGRQLFAVRCSLFAEKQRKSLKITNNG